MGETSESPDQPSLFFEQAASFLEQDASFFEQDASFFEQDASGAAVPDSCFEHEASFFEHEASFFEHEASASLAALTVFLPHEPAPHLLSACAEREAEEAMTDRASAAAERIFMVNSLID
jgi:hypothetical protein